MGTACLKGDTYKSNKPQLPSQKKPKSQQQSQQFGRGSSFHFQNLHMNGQPQSLPSKSSHRVKIFPPRSINGVSIQPTDSDMIVEDGDIVGMYKGEPMIESICQNVKKDTPNPQKQLDSGRDINGPTQLQTSKDVIKPANPQDYINRQNKNCNYKKLSTVQEESSNVYSDPLACDDPRIWNDPLALEEPIAEVDEIELESQVEVIPKKDKKQRGKATPLDMRVVNKVSMTDSNSILFSPRIEDLPVNPAKGKVQKSQQHFHRAYPSNSKLNKTDVKKYLNRKSIRG